MRKAVKKSQLVIAALLSFSMLITACGVRGSPTQASSTGTTNSLPKIRIGVDANLPPFALTDATQNELSGFEIDLIKAIADKAGFQIEFVNTAYSQMITMINKCQIDAAISSIPISNELKQQLNFSDSYYTTRDVLVVKQGNITITSREKLTGMLVGTLTGSQSIIETGTTVFQLAAYPSFNLAFQDLITGYIDAVIADKPHAQIYVETKPNRLKIIGEEFGTVNYGIAICKNSRDLLDSINNSLTEIKADGTMDKLTQKWLKDGG